RRPHARLRMRRSALPRDRLLAGRRRGRRRARARPGRPAETGALTASGWRPLTASGWRPLTASGWRPLTASGWRPLTASGWRPLILLVGPLFCWQVDARFGWPPGRRGVFDSAGRLGEVAEWLKAHAC